jgi:hypothetical protein
MNQLGLAGFAGLGSLAGQVLDTFHIQPRQTFALVSIAGIEPTVDGFKDRCLYRLAILRTYQDVLPQLLHTLLDTEYNTPHTFCLAGYSVVFQVSGHPFNSQTDDLPSHANGQTHIYPLVFGIRCFGLLKAEAPTSLHLTDRL